MALSALLFTGGCGTPEPAATPASPGPAPYFREATAASGLAFRHRQGSVLRTLPQITGAGGALLDYDGDGQLDVFLVQGSGEDDLVARGDGFVPAAGGAPRRADVVPTSRLFRGGGGRFRDVTDEAGVGARGYGMAALAWDCDNDGHTDLAVSSYGQPLALYLNRGDGTFGEAGARSGLALSSAAGTGRPGAGAASLRAEHGTVSGPAVTGTVWDSCLTTLDADRDGLLDLFRGSYLRFEEAHWLARAELAGEGAAAALTTLLPGRYQGLSSALFRNRGDGRFDVDRFGEVTAQTLGALASDMDGDGWTDLMIANDGPSPNRLLRNDCGRLRDVSRGSFADEARGSMGLAAGDVDGDGRGEIAVTHWLNPPALYRPVASASGTLRFADRAAASGLHPGRPLVGWAVAFLDADGDGALDLLEVHGGSAPSPDEPWAGRLEPQPTMLFMNRGDGFLVRATPGEGDPLARPRVGRAALAGDLDRDGAEDVVITTNNGPAEVWLGRPRPAWLALELTGTRSSRDPIGASLRLEQAGRVRVRELCSGEGYFGSNARAVTLSFGAQRAPVLVRVRWPSGLVEEHGPFGLGMRHRVVEGAGRGRK